MMEVTLLGTGDAIGTPVVGCKCETCNDGRNGGKSRRYRFSILIKSNNGSSILVDTGPDLKWQLIENDIGHIDGVIWTHGHYDHYAGFVEFHRIQRKVDVYGLSDTLDYILDYLYFLKPIRHDVQAYETFNIDNLNITLFEVTHPPLKKVVGVVVVENGKKVVITGDTCANIPKKSMDIIKEPDVLIADAIVPTGFNVQKHMDAKQALELSENIKAKYTVLTHLSHYFKPHDIATKELPLGYDGMKIIV